MAAVSDWEPVCPHARKVSGATPGDAGVICGVMERDQARADRILEGAPVGVFITVRDDPSTIANLCAGRGDPVLSPDDLPRRPFGMGHYSGCPIFAAELEVREAEARVFAAPDRSEAPPPERRPGGAPLPGFMDEGELEVSEDEDAAMRKALGL